MLAMAIIEEAAVFAFGLVAILGFIKASFTASAEGPFVITSTSCSSSF